MLPGLVRLLIAVAATSSADATTVAPAEAEVRAPEGGDGDDDVPADDDDVEVRTIVVTGTRTERPLADAPVATQVYGRQEIEDSGAENLGELLEETPGVMISRGIGGVGIMMQGLDPAYTVVLVDGMRTTGRVNNVLDLSRFPAEDIEQIEVVRGASSVLYGADALAGTINLITRTAKRPHEGELHVAYGSFNTLDLTARAGLSRRRYAGSIIAGWHRTDGFDLDPSNVSTTGPKSNQWHLTTTHELGKYGPFSLRARGSYLRRDAELINGSATGAVYDVHNRSEVITVMLRPELELGRVHIALSGSYNLWRDQYLNDQRGSSELDRVEDTFDHLAQTTLQVDYTVGKHVLTFGGDGQFEVLKADRIDPPTVDRQRYAAFLQDEWKPLGSRTIVVLPGVRADYDTYFGFYPTPRIALMIAPGRRITLRASYGRGFRAPSFREMFLLFANPAVGYTVRGNPDLKPETSWNTSFSVEVRPWQWLWLAANVFDNRLSNTIIVNTVSEGDDAEGVDTPTLFGYTNVENATTHGVETQARVSILDVLALDGSYTFVHTKDYATGGPLPGRPRHFGTAGLRFHRAAWGTTLRLRTSIFGRRLFTTTTTDDDGNDVTTRRSSPAFATMDVRLSQRCFRYLQVFVGIENLLDAGNPIDNPLQPRTYYGGATVRY